MMLTKNNSGAISSFTACIHLKGLIETQNSFWKKARLHGRYRMMVGNSLGGLTRASYASAEIGEEPMLAASDGDVLAIEYGFIQGCSKRPV